MENEQNIKDHAAANLYFALRTAKDVLPETEILKIINQVYENITILNEPYEK